MASWFYKAPFAFRGAVDGHVTGQRGTQGEHLIPMYVSATALTVRIQILPRPFPSWTRFHRVKTRLNAPFEVPD
jgi:hypothetical protein